MATGRLVVGSLALFLVLGATSCAHAPEPLRVGGNVRPPEKTRNVTPRYPPAARADQVSGVVIIEVVVDEEGYVAETDVVRSVPGLDEAALEAVTQWDYRPTFLNGVAVPVTMPVTVNFHLR